MIQPEHLHFIDMRLTQKSQQPPVLTPTKVLKSVQAEYSLTTDEEKILALVQKLGYINNALCRQLLGTNHNRASYLLKKMTGNGVLVREGTKRATSYRLPPL
ncbi:MAG: hypothetical protein DRR16_20135 [Candidatus Parabeggiatoa sp. nov. 3]|nr:MAG: hypothetical protein DRR00_08875 [Gammaproteobacteria bacterium]RKZ67765.1 MAG: hypothetical protein DRQ99_05720 [Gammaproteobacteria bacterium]RKZ82236.1 MAG: hypothetical protein DRR16_20135 [Gammaproteobacteria bacterium]HEW98937.1 hypothetical protein [Beggiatoa sp.]